MDRAKEIREWEALKTVESCGNEEPIDDEDADLIEAESEPPPSLPIAELRQRIEAQKARLSEDPLPVAAPEFGSPAASPPALLRGVSFDAAVPSRVYHYKPRVPRLDVAPLPKHLPPTDDQTEALLNALIGECHFLMQEVAFRSMCQADVLEDRRLWANTAMDFARTGAKVANSVAGLRHGVSVKETRHTTIIQNQVAAQLAGGGGSTPS